MIWNVRSRKTAAFGLVLFGFLLMLGSCLGETLGSSVDEGVIEYDVSFPYLENSVLKNVFPEEMVFHFKDGMVHGELKSLGGIVATEYIANGNDKELTQMLKAFKDRYAMILSEGDVNEMLKEMPGVTFERTAETDTIAGYLCTKTIANFTIDSVPPIVLYHTNEIDIDNPNWFTQFSAIDEVLLAYEVEQYGMRMKLRARNVRKEEVSDEKFLVPEQYKMIDRAEMEKHVDDMIKEFAVDQLP